jgi:predicted ATPase
MLTNKILLVTAAGHIDPLVKAIEDLKPDRIVLFCSENYKSKVLNTLSPCIQGERDLKIIQKPDDLTECYNRAAEAIREIQQSEPNSKIYADYTGGTKTMSLGLALASLELGVSLQVNSPVTLSTVTHPQLQLPFLESLKTAFTAEKLGNSITAFRVGNFKAFANSQYIPIRPLTLIYGANSSGKSSIIHSLLLAHHAIKNKGELDVYHTEVGGDAVDLGGFGQYVHKRDRQSQVQWAVDVDPKKLNLSDLGLSDLLNSVKQLTVGVGIGSSTSGEEQVRVSAFYIEADGEEILSMSLRPSGKLKLDRLDTEHPMIDELLNAIVQTQTYALNSPNNIKEIVNDLVPKLTVQVSGFFPKKIKVEDQDSQTSQLIQKKMQEDPIDTVRLVFPYRLSQLINATTDTVEQDIDRLRYLAPFRTYPPRHYAFSHQQDNDWYSGGGYAWDILLNNPEVRQKVNAWLGDSDRMKSPYELVVRSLLPNSQLANKLYPRLLRSLHEITTKLIFQAASWENGIQEQIDRIMNDFAEAGIEPNEITEILPEVEELVSMMSDPDTLSETWINEIAQESDKVSDLVLMDKRTKTPVSHRDVGIGVSQVMPVLVSCYGLSDSLIAIEQPELHLHPQLQAELGSVFAESIKSPQNNRFILETHSEHLVLRLQRLIREGKLTKDDVSVIYVDCEQDGSICLELRLDEEGDFIDEWPDGFFEEDFKEIFSDYAS